MTNKNGRGNMIAVNDQELALLWQALQQINIPGSVAEVYVGLKAQVRVSMEQMNATKKVEGVKDPA